MKKLILALVLFSVTTVRAQDSTAYIKKDSYKVLFLMPDASLQDIYVLASTEGEKEFSRVVQENTLQTDPVPLKTKSLGKTSFNLNGVPSIAERVAFRFLANALCESCKNSSDALSKTHSSYMVLKAANGSKNVLEVFWIANKGWMIHIITADEVKDEKILINADGRNTLYY